jgi:hypothetical protein
MKRECGNCTLCCKLLPMTNDTNDLALDATIRLMEHGLADPADFVGIGPNFDKPAGQRCPHQRHKGGCNIYSSRPFGCRMWSCRWLLGDDTADMSRPDRSHYVIDLVPDVVTCGNEGEEPYQIPVVQVWCDPDYPDAWRCPELWAYLDRRGQEGMAALIRFNKYDAITVFPPSMAGDGKWHEFAGRAGDQLLPSNRPAA